MLPRRTALALLAPIFLTLFALACGGDDAGSGDRSALSSPVATSEGSSGDTAMSVDEMTALAATPVEGYEAQAPSVVGSNVTVGYESIEEGSGLSAVVTLAPCDPFICWDLDREITDEQVTNLKSNLPTIHIENPDLIYEYGTIEVATGYEAFYTYSRSFVEEGGSKATSNGYRIIYHDGSNLISVLVTPASGPLPDSPEALEMQMDQSKGELTARTFFAAYADAFQPAE